MSVFRRRREEAQFVVTIYDMNGELIATLDDVGLYMFATYGQQPEQTIFTDDLIRVAVRRS